MKPKLSGIAYIGYRLRNARLEAHLTQGQLAEPLGTHPALIEKIEGGHTLRPRSIMLLAEALNVNPAWLQFGEPYARKNRPDKNLFEAEFTGGLALAESIVRKTKKAHFRRDPA